MPLLPPPQKNRSPPSELESRHADSRRHFEALQDLAGFRINTPHIAVVAFPRAVPELAVDPGDAGDDAVGLDGAQDGAGLRIDLMDLAAAMLPDPKYWRALLGRRRERVLRRGTWRITEAVAKSACEMGVVVKATGVGDLAQGLVRTQ